MCTPASCAVATFYLSAVADDHRRDDGALDVQRAAVVERPRRAGRTTGIDGRAVEFVARALAAGRVARTDDNVGAGFERESGAGVGRHLHVIVIGFPQALDLDFELNSAKFCRER